MSEQLEDLRGAWARAVKLRETDFGRTIAAPCWFGDNVPGIDSCEGWIEGAHWVKRQRVERTVAEQLQVPAPELRIAAVKGLEWVSELYRVAIELVWLAAWDRNGVPACEKHHRRFDGHTVDARDPLVIWRHEVPAHVEAFCLDWPLEGALEDRNPPIGAGV